MNDRLFDFIEACPTPFHTVAHTADILKNAGFTELCERDSWEPEPGRGYYVTRNGSSLIAFRLPPDDFVGFMMAAAHCDSPCFRIKENAELDGSCCSRLSTEGYGGMICSSWMDRPLSVAGRVMLRTESGVRTELVDLDGVQALIPNLAIHMNRSVNSSASYNAAVDMLPIYSSGTEPGGFRRAVAAAVDANEEDILSWDLSLYVPQRGTEWNGFISAPRLDDLQCAFGALTAFLGADDSGSTKVFCLFDNEEVGSRTKQGAASTFLTDVLTRIVRSTGGDDTVYRRAVSESFLVSCDNAHAVHPNHPEFSDRNHSVYMNGGIVIKYNASQKYATDAVSSALFRLICEEAGIPVQLYANRADMLGGSTLGNIANEHVSLNTVDIGLPQLAMHSAYETAGADDTEMLVRALTVFYEKTLCMERDGEYKLL